MDSMNIIGQLEEQGFIFRLAIDYEYTGEPSPEAEALLHRLADARESAIDCLIAGRFVPLPDDTAIPAEWNINGKMKRYILDTPERILNTVEEHHSPLFSLLWAVKALCFINGGKVLYERTEDIIREAYGFDYERYAGEWKRYTDMLGGTGTVSPELSEVQVRLRDMGARI